LIFLALLDTVHPTPPGTHMRPILFYWRGLTVWSYPAMLYLGLLAGIVSGNAAAHAAGLDAFRVYVATLTLIAAGLIGARLFYVVLHWPFYRTNLDRVWNRKDGGVAMYGGFAVMLPLSVPLLYALRLPLGAFWDVTVFTVLVLMIFARIGCLLNGCCAGRPSKSRLSIRLPNSAGVWDRRIPTQILEAALSAVLLVCAMTMWRWLPFPSALSLVIAAGYGAARLLLESTREQCRGRSRFTVQHGISVALVVFSLAVLSARWPK
jgi:phosphatidylglycerol---prolipoprotein diacylglyceryl transferase